MSLACEPKKPTPSYAARIIQQTYRDIGLSPIFNSNVSTEVCLENFTTPTFTTSGDSKEILSCPDGYTKSCGNDACVQITTTGATATAGSGTTISASSPNLQNGSLGAYFYQNIQDRSLPIYRSGSTEVNLIDVTGGTITTTNIVSGDTFWDSNGLITQGRLNLTGIIQGINEWRGVSYCFEECSATTQYIGYGTGGSNGTSRITIDGELIINTVSATTYDTYIWNVVPWNFTSGKHIIEFESNGTEYSAMEVYKPTNGLGQLTGATTSGDTGVVFSTVDRIGTPYDIGVTAGYTCPTGYSMDTCGSGLTCTLLDYTGITSSVFSYNLDVVDEINLEYNFTGSTQYTGYTGFWCYEVMGTIPYGELKKSCIPYSNIIDGTILIDVIDGLPLIDNEYIVKSNNKFKSKCVNTYTDKKVRWLKNGRQSNSITRGPAVGYIDTSSFIDLEPEVNNDDGLLGLFTPLINIKDSDIYFITVVDPPTPILEFIPFDVFESITFRSETLIPEVDGSNSLLLIAPPVAGLVLLSVNGITVSPNDYEIDTDTNLLTMLNNITFETSDVVQAYYNTTPVTESSLLALENRVKLEMYAIDSIVSGITATTYNNTVNWNSDNSRYEFFLTEKMDPNIQPIINLNGVILVYNIDIFRSSVIPNKLIFKDGTVLEIGDIISVWYYFSGFNGVGDLGTLLTDKPSFKWTEQTNVLKRGGYYGNSTGLFTVEITNREDNDFNNILYSNTKVYNNNESTYTLTVGPIATTPYTKYIYRIKFTKTYATSITNNSVDTTSYSEVGTFSLNKNYIDNSRF